MLQPCLALSAALLTALPVHLSGVAAAALIDDDADYEAAIEALDQANTKVNSDPEKHMAELADALEALADYSRQLANDSDASRLVTMATLNLTRAMLMAGDRAGAEQTMDELLRRSPGETLPVQRFGPTLVEFHDARVAALRQLGTAELQFDCEISCRVLLDRHTVTVRSGPLYLGEYDVTIESQDGSLPPEHHEVTLDEAGTVVMLHYPLAGLSKPDEAPAERVPASRLAPRWAEIVLAIVGAGAVGAGSAMLALDGRCPGGGDPIDDAGTICPNLYEMSAIGAATLGLGAVVMTTGVVLLSVDEVQAKNGREGQQVMLHYRVNF